MIHSQQQYSLEKPDKAGTFFTSFDARSLYANLFEYFFNKQTIGKKMSKEQVGMELLIKRENVLRSKLGEQLMVVGNLKKLHDQFNSFAEPNCAAQTNVLSAIDELQKDHHNCLQELENVRNQMIEEKRKRKVAIMQNLCKAKRELTRSTRINARKFGIVAKVQISTEEKLFSIISLNGEDDLSNGEKFKVLMCIIRALWVHGLFQSPFGILGKWDDFLSDDEDIKAVEDILMKNAKELEKQFYLAIPNR